MAHCSETVHCLTTQVYGLTQTAHMQIAMERFRLLAANSWLTLHAQDMGEAPLLGC